MDIHTIMSDIIPPDDYQNRNGFSNVHIIDNLNDLERVLVEDTLIVMLLNKADMLVVETLAYMKSLKSIPSLINLLNQCSDPIGRIIIATSIFEINHDSKMITVSIDAFKNLSDLYQKINAFYYLRKFKDSLTDEIIKEYIVHPNYLLAYNAKQALGT